MPLSGVLPGRNERMGRTAAPALSLIAMVGLIVVVDVLFLREHFWLRLGVNVGIVAAFAALYLRLQSRL
jgi:hypothetical protein